MTIDLILKEVTQLRPELNRQEARAIATDIYYSGEAPSEILGSKSTIDKLLSGYQARQAAAASQVAANDPSTCPVCKLPLKPVLLTNDRNAVFCQKHFVVFPVLPEKKGE